MLNRDAIGRSRKAPDLANLVVVAVVLAIATALTTCAPSMNSRAPSFIDLQLTELTLTDAKARDSRRVAMTAGAKRHRAIWHCSQVHEISSAASAVPTTRKRSRHG